MPVFAGVERWESSLPKKSTFASESILQKRVDFWVDIYSKYTTSEGVFHDVSRPYIIYGTIDLSPIMDSSVLNDSEKKRQISKALRLQKNKIAATRNIKDINSIRLQMGLKDRMQKAFYISGKYLPMIEKVFKDKKLPIELTRIIFVESSFNVFAQSKVSASGLWQIMPAVGKSEGYLQKYYDNRNHPYYSTVLAADILQANYESLRSWPLAITAYNHGLTGVYRMTNKVGSKKISRLIESKNKTKNWGFASENFYACFLAVLKVEKNANQFFGDDLIRAKPLAVKNINLKIATQKSTILKMYNGDMNKFKNYNPHLKFSKFKLSKYLPAGTPLVVPNRTML